MTMINATRQKILDTPIQCCIYRKYKYPNRRPLVGSFGAINFIYHLELTHLLGSWISGSFGAMELIVRQLQLTVLSLADCIYQHPDSSVQRNPGKVRMSSVIQSDLIRYNI